MYYYFSCWSESAPPPERERELESKVCWGNLFLIHREQMNVNPIDDDDERIHKHKTLSHKNCSAKTKTKVKQE